MNSGFTAAWSLPSWINKEGGRWKPLSVLAGKACARLRGVRVEIERRLDASHWLRFHGRYVPLHICLEVPPLAKFLPVFGLQHSPIKNPKHTGDHMSSVNQVSAVRGHYTESLGEDLDFVAASPMMVSILAQLSGVATVDVPVLLLGESGAGKDVAARLIHKRSPRAQHTFLKVNCAALPAELLESELFGHEAGAFTGANKTKPGKFELCNKGTIFLDEIGEMPASMQAKLLQVLERPAIFEIGRPDAGDRRRAYCGCNKC